MLLDRADVERTGLWCERVITGQVRNGGDARETQVRFRLAYGADRDLHVYAVCDRTLLRAGERKLRERGNGGQRDSSQDHEVARSPAQRLA